MSQFYIVEGKVYTENELTLDINALLNEWYAE